MTTQEFDTSADGGDDDTTDVTQTRLSVPGMDCPSCAGKVESALSEVDGIGQFETYPTTGTVKIRRSGDGPRDDDIVAAIEDAGYDVEGTGDTADSKDPVWASPRAKKTWVSGAVVAIGLLLEFAFTGANVSLVALFNTDIHLADLLFLLAVAGAGQEIIRGGYYSAQSLSLDIDLLMSIAILGAIVASLVFGESLYFEAATLTVLFSTAELLEEYSMEQARSSLTELMDLSPDEATVLRDGEQVTVPVEAVDVGDSVAINPGEKIPLDGEVSDGTSAVNQAPITGESVPIDKTAGDTVYAGSINEEGYLEVRVTSTAGDNTLSRIVQLVEDAQSNKTDREQFVERFSSYYTPAVVAFAILVVVVTPFALGVSWPTAVVYGLTLLVLACPCAFVISTPVSVVSGITSAAKNGVLIKGGNHLESMGAVDVVAFDKTGTLTKGELTVTDVIPLNGNTESDVLRCAQGLESRSEHPISEAIVDAAEGKIQRDIDSFESITGKGVRAEIGGTPHYAGKPGLFEELGFDLTHVHATTDGGVVTETAKGLCEKHNCLDLLDGTVPQLQSEGKTVILVGKVEDGPNGSDDAATELEGIIAVADELRPEAKTTIEHLKSLGIERTVMLTGDNERTAGAIAEQAGIDTYQAELLPEEKVRHVESLAEETDGVAMVGDGINDAPALATATVGIAMGAAGTDTALETADIALMGDELSKLPYVYELSNNANGVIRQNIWASLAVKLGLTLAVPFGYVPIWLAVLAGDAGMTTAVTGNAMRLSRIRAEE